MLLIDWLVKFKLFDVRLHARAAISFLVHIISCHMNKSSPVVALAAYLIASAPKGRAENLTRLFARISHPSSVPFIIVALCLMPHLPYE